MAAETHAMLAPIELSLTAVEKSLEDWPVVTSVCGTALLALIALTVGTLVWEALHEGLVAGGVYHAR